MEETAEGQGPASSPFNILGQRQFLVAGKFLDIDVLEGEDPDAFHKARRPVHVPDPGVLQRQVEVDFPVCAPRLQVHVVGKVKTPFGLDNVAEQADNIAVFTVELQLHVSLIVFKILSTHASILHHDRRRQRRGTAASVIPSKAVRGFSGR